MRLEIRILSGALAGAVQAFEEIPVSAGRGPEAGLRFHGTRDLSVSTRHALLYPEGKRWWIRDLHSRNGTFVNGRPVEGPTPLSHGDRITFGSDGPEVEVVLPDRTSFDPDRRVTPGTLVVPGLHGPVRPGRRSLLLTGVGGAAIGLLLVVILYLVNAGERERAAWERERAALLSRLDSVLLAGDVTVLALAGEREELARALSESQEALREARSELEGALGAGDATRVEDLRRELQERTTALERQQLAASLDFDAIERGNRRAVALVYVESEMGEVTTGTAFAVRSDATLLTARHLVRGEDGQMAVRRIGVQFSDSDQVFPARVLGSDPAHDLAVLAVDNVLGVVPVIRGFNAEGETLGSGAPVAVIGFPLGGNVGGPDTPAPVARPLVSSGVIAAWASDQVEIVGYGAAGASGSPIFDAEGRVIALLFGGVQRADGHRVFGVPAREAIRFLDGFP